MATAQGRIFRAGLLAEHFEAALGIAPGGEAAGVQDALNV
jgi:hypothetical protein